MLEFLLACVRVCIEPHSQKHIIGSVQIDLRSFYQALTRTNTHEETKRDQDKKWFLKLGSFVVVVDVVVVVGP